MKRLTLLLVVITLVCSSILKAQPDSAFSKAQRLYGSQNYSEAVDYYSKYIQSFDSKLADYFKAMKDYDTAAVFAQARKFSPYSYNHKWAVAYYEQGMCNLNLGDKAKAQEDFEKSIHIDPAYAGPCLQEGLLIKSKDKLEACVLFAKAKMLSDTFKAAKDAYTDNFCWMCGRDAFLKGKTDVELRQFAEGIENLNNAITFSSDSGNYYVYRGMAYEGLGNMDSALSSYSSAISHDSTRYLGYYRRGLVYAGMQKYQEAFDDFSKALLRNPRFADGYLHRAEVCENLDMQSSAIFDYKQLLKLKPNVGEAWYKLGVDKKSHGEDACDYFQKALDLGYDDAQADVDECNKEKARKSLK